MAKPKFYITTSIAYANANPHIGYAMELAQADAFARYYRAQGREVFYATGTDEHGTKIYRTAKANKQPPQKFVDQISRRFLDLTKALNVSNDVFVRTTDAKHKKIAQAFWRACKKGDIYKSKYDGLYCVGCELYYTAQEAAGGKCPIHKTKLEKLSEENYFFKLSQYTAAIKKLISDDQLKIIPDTRKNEILALLDRGLEDVSISRSKDKLPWGVEVPGDPDQVMYVWFDALPNYVSVLDWPAGAGFKKFWPADTHVIGKDILRQHAALWPAMLLSAGLELPQTIYVHGFIESGGHKMSKSLGNVIDPFEVIAKYSSDALRYYLLREIPFGGDGDFTWERFNLVYDSDLANELGNLVSRVAAMVTKYQDGAVGEVPDGIHDDQAFHQAMADWRLDLALTDIWLLVKELNQFIDEEKPWELFKTDKTQLSKVLDHAVADLRQISHLLEPFLPATAAKIQTAFGGAKVKDAGILFPKNDTITKTEFKV